MDFNQSAFQVRCEWGEKGIQQLASISDVVIIVDVLSFSTCIDIVVSRGAIAFPYAWNAESAVTFAQSIGAELADKRGSSRYSLSPTSLLHMTPGTRLVLPSPNGSALSLATATTPTLTGCLRNSRAIAQAAMEYGQRIAVIPAGEKWIDGSLRPAFEDWIGAGAIISHFSKNLSLSPEAEAAVAAYQVIQPNLRDRLQQCGSGQELIERGFAPDVDLAAEVNVSDRVPTLVDGSYRHRVG